jgi:hypothetical protein
LKRACPSLSRRRARSVTCPSCRLAPHSPFPTPWYPGTLAPWHPGTLAPWHPGTLAPWHPGTLAPWHPSTPSDLPPSLPPSHFSLFTFHLSPFTFHLSPFTSLIAKKHYAAIIMSALQCGFFRDRVLERPWWPGCMSALGWIRRPEGHYKAKGGYS